MQETIYSVSQAVKLLEVQPHVLRYWEEEMKLPIGRNEMGHRYYTRWDIQMFLSIKELKKKGYSLKNIGELTAFFYREHTRGDEPAKDLGQAEADKTARKSEQTEADITARESGQAEVKRTAKMSGAVKPDKQVKISGTVKRGKTAKAKRQIIKENKISPEFLEIVSRIVLERVKEKNSEEARYKRLDERIRNCQQTRRETAAAAEKSKKKKRLFKRIQG